MTSWHKTGAHPFYIGMHLHIYTHIYVHKYTSQKECLHIFCVCVVSYCLLFCVPFFLFCSYPKEPQGPVLFRFTAHMFYTKTMELFKVGCFI